MNRTVIALYDDFQHANDAVRELVDHGFTRADISLMASDASGEYNRYVENRDTAADSGTAQGAGVGAGIGAVIGGLGGLLVGLGALTIPGIGPVLAAGPLAAALTGLAGAGVGAVAGGVTGGLIGALVDLGVPEETAGYYAEGVRRGGTLVTVKTDDAMANQAVDILNRHNPIDINQRAVQWRESGWTGFTTNTQSEVRTSTASESDWPRTETRAAGEMADRSVSSVSTSDLSRAYQDFNSFDPRFRQHFETSMVDTGYTYDQFAPAYRYGYDLATDDRFRDYDWNRVEPEARRYWDERNPGTWERFKLAVRHAWEEIKDTAR